MQQTNEFHKELLTLLMKHDILKEGKQQIVINTNIETQDLSKQNINWSVSFHLNDLKSETLHFIIPFDGIIEELKADGYDIVTERTDWIMVDGFNIDFELKESGNLKLSSANFYEEIVKEKSNTETIISSIRLLTENEREFLNNEIE